MRLCGMHYSGCDSRRAGAVVAMFFLVGIAWVDDIVIDLFLNLHAFLAELGQTLRQLLLRSAKKHNDAKQHATLHFIGAGQNLTHLLRSGNRPAKVLSIDLGYCNICNSAGSPLCSQS